MLISKTKPLIERLQDALPHGGLGGAILFCWAAGQGGQGKH
jgi:hypothetical protein